MPDYPRVRFSILKCLANHRIHERARDGPLSEDALIVVTECSGYEHAAQIRWIGVLMLPRDPFAKGIRGIFEIALQSGGVVGVTALDIERYLQVVFLSSDGENDLFRIPQRGCEGLGASRQ